MILLRAVVMVAIIAPASVGLAVESEDPEALIRQGNELFRTDRGVTAKMN